MNASVTIQQNGVGGERKRRDFFSDQKSPIIFLYMNVFRLSQEIMRISAEQSV
jgi:hypothetical protein